MPLDHLEQASKARSGVLLRDQECRVDGAGGIVHGDDQIERRLVGQPGVFRAILMQQHAAHRPPRPLAAMAAAPGCRLDHPGLLQVEPGGDVAELVAVPLLKLLVEVLDGEALIVLLIQRAHAPELVFERASGRGLADPAIDQAIRPSSS
jgi:hypothetical protein